MSDSLRPHESQQARPPCPSPTPGVHPNSCASSRWCHPAISSSVVPFSSCPQSLPASGSFPMTLNSSHEVAKVLEFQPQHQSFQWTPRTGLQSKGLTRVFSSTTVQKHQFFSAQLSSQSSSHIHIVHTKFWEKHFSVCFPWNTSSLQCRLCYMKYFMLSPLWVSKGLFVC